jgi:nucleoside-diphosphate-sugar epimerase
MKFLITGANGFVGRHICRQLVERGFIVSALVRRPDEELTQLGVTVSLSPSWEAPALAESLSGADIVVHCAGEARFGNGRRYQNNVLMTGNLIEAVKLFAPGLSRFVFISSIGAVDRKPDDECSAPLNENSPPFPRSDYGRSKLEAEGLVTASGIPYSIVRPAMVVGGDMRFDSHFSVFAGCALRRSPVSRFKWPGSFSIIHVDDLSTAVITVALKEEAVGQTFFCAGETISVEDYFEMTAPGIRRLPLKWLSKTAFRFIHRRLPFQLKAMLYPALTASDAKLRSLGWSNSYTAEEALAGVIERERARFDPREYPGGGGRTVVTGAASGLGRALAEKLLPYRDELLLIDKEAEGLASLKEKFPAVKTMVVDLSQKNELENLLRSPEWRRLPITELFACAGFGLRGTVSQLAPDAQWAIFETNVMARLFLAHGAVRSMLRRAFGRVIFISSSSAFQALPFMAAYAASNSALLSLGEAWAEELARQGIQMLTVCPGGMDSNFQERAGVKKSASEKLMPPETVADEIFRRLGVKSGRMTVSGRSWAMSFMARVLPSSISLRLWGGLMRKLR